MWLHPTRSAAILACAGAAALVLGPVARRRLASRSTEGVSGTRVRSDDGLLDTGVVVAPPVASPAPMDALPIERATARAATDAVGFRPDIEGLRGLAILLVLLFHAALPVSGGFVGVDVFFVISGFLITGMLVREVERSGDIALVRFYARRIRRLLPATAVVLAVTLPLAYVATAPLDRSQAMTDGMAAMLSVSNIRSALADGDYFAAVSGPSPFLHFWSLAIEEQFYLFWPLVLLLVTRAGRVRPRAAVALAVILVASLATSVVMTDASPTWGFYMLPSRAWQFAAGGLLAIGAGLVTRVPRSVVALAGWSGAAILVGCALALDGSMRYPGLLAVVPTIAAVLLIAAGPARWGPGILLSVAPMRFLGRISFSLYLWHWPILVLPAIALGTALDPTTTIGLLGLAIVVAWVSWAVVERPFNRPMAVGSPVPRRSLAIGATSMAMIVALAGSLGVAATQASSGDWLATSADPTIDPQSVDDLGPAVDADSPGAPDADGIGVPSNSATDPTPAPTTGQASPSSAVPSTPPVASPPPAPVTAPVVAADRTLSIPEGNERQAIPLPAGVRPTVSQARDDIERLFADGCVTQPLGTRPASCVYGDRHGAITIALVGDSHASHWFPALNILATRHGWRLVPYVKTSCPFVDMPVWHVGMKREYTECETWRGRVIAALNAERPDLVIVGSGYRAIIAARHADDSPERQAAAMARAIAELESPVAVMIDNPRASFDIPACLSAHRSDVRACAIPRAMAFPDQFGLRERMAAETTGAGLLDMVAAVCPETPCQVVRDGHILYRDGHHLTATFVRSLADRLDAALAPFLPGARVDAADPLPSRWPGS